MGLGIPALKIKIMLESSPLKSIMLVGRLDVANESHIKAKSQFYMSIFDSILHVETKSMAMLITIRINNNMNATNNSIKQQR